MWPSKNTVPLPQHQNVCQSFYGVYGELFARLAANERIAGARADMPALGGPSSAWAGVAAFYAHWTAFSTVKDFSWADQYNPASAPNRKARGGEEEGGSWGLRHGGSERGDLAQPGRPLPCSRLCHPTPSPCPRCGA